MRSSGNCRAARMLCTRKLAPKLRFRTQEDASCGSDVISVAVFVSLLIWDPYPMAEMEHVDTQLACS